MSKQVFEHNTEHNSKYVRRIVASELKNSRIVKYLSIIDATLFAGWFSSAIYRQMGVDSVNYINCSTKPNLIKLFGY